MFFLAVFWLVEQQCHCNGKNRNIVLKLEWSNWSLSVFAGKCVCMCLCLSLCVYCGIWDKWGVWERAWEATSSHYAQLPICLQASLPAADLFEFNLREAVKLAWSRWGKHLHFLYLENTMKRFAFLETHWLDFFVVVFFFFTFLLKIHLIWVFLSQQLFFPPVLIN